MVHVIPGYISYQDRQYDSVYDPKGTEARFGQPGTGAQVLPEDFHLISPVHLDVSLDACVTELSSGLVLQFFYKLSATYGTIILRPGQFVKQLLYRRRKIFCDGTSCNKKLALPCAVMSSFGSMDFEDPAFGSEMGTSGAAGCIWPCSDDTSRCMVLAHLLFKGDNDLDPKYNGETVLLDGECLPCCTASYFKKMTQELSDYDREFAPQDGSSIDEIDDWYNDVFRYRILNIVT
ncbi:hypothetical protein MMC17_003678 [Xylographa soralifera]|nr:hypothetical protein [Xylographa soralifera]